MTMLDLFLVQRESNILTMQERRREVKIGDVVGSGPAIVGGENKETTFFVVVTDLDRYNEALKSPTGRENYIELGTPGTQMMTSAEYEEYKAELQNKQ